MAMGTFGNNYHYHFVEETMDKRACSPTTTLAGVFLRGIAALVFVGGKRMKP